MIDRAGIDDEGFAVKSKGEAIHAPGGGFFQPFAIDIVVRTVAGALETVTLIAERHDTTQVDTTVIEGNPVGAIVILDNIFYCQLIFKLHAMHQKLRILLQSDYVSFGLQN